MKKNIIIGALAVLTVLSFVYARVQQTEAVRQRELADLNAQQVVEFQKIAEEQRALADKNAHEAIRAQAVAEAQRQIAMECASRKIK